MLEMICAIPESFGWSMVGFFACLLLVVAVKLGKMLIQAWKERHEDEEVAE